MGKPWDLRDNELERDMEEKIDKRTEDLAVAKSEY